MPHHLAPTVALAFALAAASHAGPQQRTLQPEHLFRVERIGATAWSATGDLASVELPRAGRWLDRGIPTSALDMWTHLEEWLRETMPPAPR